MKKLLLTAITMCILVITAAAQAGWETQTPKGCFCCNEQVYNLPVKPPIAGSNVLSCDSVTQFATYNCQGAQVQWTVTPALATPITGQGTSVISLYPPYNASSYTITVTIKCGKKTVTNQRVVKVKLIANCTAKSSIVLTELPTGLFRLDATPSTTSGVWHYWGVVGNDNGAACTHIPLKQIETGGTFGASISPTGVFKAIGMGTGINAGPTGYGYQYSGLGNKGCFKLTHYVKCCEGWFVQTHCFCISQTSGKLSIPTGSEQSVPNSSAKIRLLKPHEIKVTESSLEKVSENDVPKEVKEATERLGKRINGLQPLTNENQ